MDQVFLKLVVAVLVILYALAGVGCVVALYQQARWQVAWTALAAFWLFLGVSMWRLSRFARGVSILLLWVVLGVVAYIIIQPIYLSELAPRIVIPEMAKLPTSYMYGGIVGAALISLAVLGKYRNEFR